MEQLRDQPQTSLSPLSLMDLAFPHGEDSEKQRCPYPDCDTLKDLKTHVLTHQDERTERYPMEANYLI